MATWRDWQAWAELGDLDVGLGDVILLQTVDFITPVLDDPYAFGQVAAANSLSDIYAMGGRPVSAMNLVAFPASRVGLEVLGTILKGGRDKVQESRARLVGGHSVEDDEPKYGLAVTGLARRSELMLQSAGRPGDVLYLTKPIGGGVLSALLKRDGLPPTLLGEFTHVLTTLNDYARDAAVAAGARCATDVTGFGLLGHLSNLILASGVGVELKAAATPVLPGALEAAERQVFPGGAQRNLDFVGSRLGLTFDPHLEPWRRKLLADPMTSGGLLVAVPEAGVNLFEAHLGPMSCDGGHRPTWARIGRLTDRRAQLEVD